MGFLTLSNPSGSLALVDNYTKPRGGMDVDQFSTRSSVAGARRPMFTLLKRPSICSARFFLRFSESGTWPCRFSICHGGSPAQILNKCFATAQPLVKGLNRHGNSPKNVRRILADTAVGNGQPLLAAKAKHKN